MRLQLRKDTCYLIWESQQHCILGKCWRGWNPWMDTSASSLSRKPVGFWEGPPSWLKMNWSPAPCRCCLSSGRTRWWLQECSPTLGDLFRPIFQLNMSIFNVRKFLRFKNAIQFSIDQAVWICTNDNGQISTSRIKLRNCLQKDQNKNFNWMSIESSFEIQVPILLMKLFDTSSELHWKFWLIHAST